jgi:hypothetical protein
MAGATAEAEGGLAFAGDAAAEARTKRQASRGRWWWWWRRLIFGFLSLSKAGRQTDSGNGKLIRCCFLFFWF